MGRSVLKGNTRIVGSFQKKVQGDGNGSYEIKFVGKSSAIQEVRYKKENKGDRCISSYKPHPHLKCPHRHLTALLFLFRGLFLQINLIVDSL